jgi:macrolide-specific efflux system membrane fusion protein
VVTYGVTVGVDKIPTGAKVGQTVSVSVTTGSVQDAVFVNSAAVTTVGNRHTVTVLANGQQQVTAVEIGLEGDEATQIKSGVEVGQQVVLKTTTTSTGGTNGFPGGGFGGNFGGGAFPGGGTGRGTGRTGGGTGGTR